MEIPDEHDEEEDECLASLLELMEDFPLSLLLVVAPNNTFFGDFDLLRKNLAIFLDLLLLGDFPLVSVNWSGITTGDCGGVERADSFFPVPLPLCMLRVEEVEPFVVTLFTLLDTNPLTPCLLPVPLIL